MSPSDPPSAAASAADTSSTGIRRKIWDVPTRLTHWALVILVACSWWTAEIGELAWHRRSGYGILGLVIFRLFWGIAGSSTARFASFVAGPRAVANYMRSHLFDRSHISPGHNPLGGWSIVAMLALLSAQTGTGLFAVDVDGIESGPFSHWVSFDTGRALADVHEWIFNTLLALIVLHLLAVAYYAIYKREGLIAAMVGGFKSLPAKAVHGPISFAPWWRVLAGVAVAVAIVVCVAFGFQF